MQFATGRKAIGKAVVAGIFILIIVVAAAVGIYYSTTLGGKSSSSTSQTTQGKVDTLVVDDIFWPAGELNQLNAIFAIPFPNWLTYTVYQPLVTLNATSLNQGRIDYLPVLSTGWDVSSDGRTYTFKLRNTNFSNGDPFNSYQVWGEMYALYYLSGNNSNWYLDYPVFDMSTSHFGPSTIALMQQSGLTHPSAQMMTIMKDTSWPIYVVDEHTITFHLIAPFQWFLGTLVVFQGLIFDTQFALDHGGFGTPAAFNTYFNLKPMPGTGPYVVSGVAENAFVKLSKNPNYWGKNLTPAQVKSNPYIDPGHVQNVLIQVRSDDVARFTDLSSGKSQIGTILSTNWPLVLASPDKYTYIQVPPISMLISGVAINVHRYPTNITAVRQAIAYAINYTDISVKVFHSGLNPWNGPEYPSWKDYYDLGGHGPFQYNLTKAKQILSQNNIDTSKFPAIEFRVLAGVSFAESTAEIIQADLAQIGINVNVEVTPSATYNVPFIAGPTSYATALQDAQTISQLTWLGSATFAPGAVTPADSWLAWVNGNTPANNWAIYANPTVQKCVDAWTATSDTNQIKLLCTAAQEQINNDVPYIWLGSLSLVVGSGSIVYDKAVISGMLLDPVFTGQSDTAIFNTVTFTNGQ